MEGGDRVARVRLKPDERRRICNGKVTSAGEVEIRGMRTEVEFRVAGRFLGRLEKTSFNALIEAAEAARS